MELFFELTPETVLAITGSDGKTTTTTLTYKILEAELKKKGESYAEEIANLSARLEKIDQKLGVAT